MDFQSFKDIQIRKYNATKDQKFPAHEFPPLEGWRKNLTENSGFTFSAE